MQMWYLRYKSDGKILKRVFIRQDAMRKAVETANKGVMLNGWGGFEWYPNARFIGTGSCWVD